MFNIFVVKLIYKLFPIVPTSLISFNDYHTPLASLILYHKKYTEVIIISQQCMKVKYY